MDHVQGDGDITTRDGWKTQAAFHLICSRGASAVPGLSIYYDVKLYHSPTWDLRAVGFLQWRTSSSHPLAKDCLVARLVHPAWASYPCFELHQCTAPPIAFYSIYKKLYVLRTYKCLALWVTRCGHIPPRAAGPTSKNSFRHLKNTWSHLKNTSSHL